MFTKHIIKSLFLLVATSILMLGMPQPIKTTTNPNNDIHVIFDMNGVLTKNCNETKILGYSKFIMYALLRGPFGIKQKVRKKLYEFLETLEQRQPGEINASDEQNTQLPQIMCTWMKGDKTPEQLLDLVDKEVEQRAKGLEVNLLAAIARMMFTPELMVETQEFVTQSVAFVDELKSQGYHVHILSNFDSYTFELLKEKYADVFARFDSVLVSGDVGLIKPDPNIYELLLISNNIDRTKAFFIDDTPCNVEVAKQQSIASVLCKGKNPDIASVKNTFYAWREQLDTAQEAHA